MDPQSKEQQAQSVAAMADRALGTQQPAAAPQQQAPAPQQQAPQQPTQMDQANTQGSPQTEGDKMNQDPVEMARYKVNFGEGDERELTEAQIKGTFDRYTKLNEAHTYMRPIMEASARMLQQNPGMSPQQLVQMMVQRSNQPLQQGGPDARPNQPGANNPPKNAEQISAEFEKWEKDNAASLPPGYKEMMTGQQSQQAQMAQMMNMMQQVLGRTQGVMDASRQAHQGAQGQMVNATKQRIENNLNQVQQRLGLGDDQAENFQIFAAERGYTMEDFIDPMLTLKVANDFRNSLNSGEFSRLKEMASRRQAFTGTVQSQPGSQQGGPDGENAALEAMINRNM